MLEISAYDFKTCGIGQKFAEIVRSCSLMKTLFQLNIRCNTPWMCNIINIHENITIIACRTSMISCMENLASYMGKNQFNHVESWLLRVGIQLSHKGKLLCGNIIPHFPVPRSCNFLQEIANSHMHASYRRKSVAVGSMWELCGFLYGGRNELPPEPQCKNLTKSGQKYVSVLWKIGQSNAI